MSQAFHDPSINFHRVWERYTGTRLKLLKCTFISTQTFVTDVSQLFFLDLFLILNFLPKLTVKWDGQRLASSRLFWPATGPYWQHWVRCIGVSIYHTNNGSYKIFCFLCKRRIWYIRAISLRYICTIFPVYTHSQWHSWTWRSAQCFKNIQAWGVIIVSLWQFCFVWSKPHSSSNVNDWPVKLRLLHALPDVQSYNPFTPTKHV